MKRDSFRASSRSASLRLSRRHDRSAVPGDAAVAGHRRGKASRFLRAAWAPESWSPLVSALEKRIIAEDVSPRRPSDSAEGRRQRRDELDSAGNRKPSRSDRTKKIDALIACTARTRSVSPAAAGTRTRIHDAVLRWQPPITDHERLVDIVTAAIKVAQEPLIARIDAIERRMSGGCGPRTRPIVGCWLSGGARVGVHGQ